MAPAPQDQGGDAGALGGELQAAARDHRQMADLADHGGKPRGQTAAQPFLDGPQDLLVASRPDQHEAGGAKPMGQEAGAIKVQPPEAPQHRPDAEPGEDAGDKTRRGSAVFLIAADAGYLVHGAARQAATRQGKVDRADLEWQHAMPGGLFDMPDAIAQRCQAAAGRARHVAILFYIFYGLSIRFVLSLRCAMAKAPHPARSQSAADAAEITARILLETESVLFRPEDPFTFTSGLRSPVYIDCRRLISFPRARKKLMDLAAALIERHSGFESLDAIAGGETAGIPFAAWIADRLSLPMLYVRKQPKGFGRNAQIEGELKEGARVLLVEDLASEGTSKLNFVRAIRQAGGRIEDAFVIFNYGIFPQIDTSLAAEGITLLALATWWDVAETAERLGRFAPGQYKAIESFLKDPEAWAKARTAARR
jgi:orotate phosphoribosyltransferase